MKSDYSRITFDPRKHFSSVRMQQGRVQIDADSNEQVDIVNQRVETEAGDVIGLCGAPLHYPAFHIVGALNQLTTEEQALPGNKTLPTGFAIPDFLISAGRYYVDGILCENEQLTSYLKQADLPDATPIAETGLYLVYVDVWQRLLTALDDPSILEIALGGPDTATRAKTVWQVKYWFAGTSAGNCLTKFTDFEKLIAPSDGTLSARSKPAQASTDPCIVPPGAGYTGLENQLYRVEIHDGGAALDVTTGGELATRVPNKSDQISVSGAWEEGWAIEIFSSKAGSDSTKGTLAYIVKVEAEKTTKAQAGKTAKTEARRTTKAEAGKKILTLNVDVSKIALDELRVTEAKATFKWSRDNGVVVTTIQSINGQEVTVHDLGPDDALGFKEGQWVEIIDDGLELNGLPGQLAQITKIDSAIKLITLNVVPTPLDATQSSGVNKDRHPKLRRWDGVGAVKFHPNVSEDHFLDLESGVQVRFFAGSFRTGDYWTTAARTATADMQSGNIEWPQVSNTPLVLPPFGIQHHYCRLAMLHWDGTQFDTVEDCRDLFPPITELTSLLYVSGDGQEAMPNNPLPQLLQVGVFNGRWPVAGAHVRFVAQGNGRLAADLARLPASTTNTLTGGDAIVTGLDGIASCAWRLEPDVTKPSQQVEARLLDANGDPLPPVVRFNGNLSIADQVFYDPGECQTLQGRNTVQKAIDQLSDLISLYEVSGNNQEVMPGAALEPLKVLAANTCGPVEGQKVSFKVMTSSGNVAPAESITDASGIATTIWTLDPSMPSQQVEASLVDDSAPSIAAPTAVRFTANLSIASQVAYNPDPEECPDLAKAKVTTVQEALDELCKRTPQAEPGIRINQILTEADGRALLNDTLVQVSRLAKGITIICDAPVIPLSVGASPDPPGKFPEAVAGKPTCFVTLDLPFPLVDDDRLFWGAPRVIGFQPLILGCSVSVTKNEIRWSPTNDANRWLQTGLMQRLLNAQIADRVLAHLTLKGNFIWSQDSEKESALYLDAEAFGIPSPSNRIDLRFPTGDGRRGGDFEMWFWLIVTKSVPFPGLVLDVSAGINGIRGSVRDISGGVIAGAEVTLTGPTAVPRTAVTDDQGEFLFLKTPPGTYQVSAHAGNLSAEKTVTV